MKKSIFLKISAITFLMAGVVFCGCSNSNDEPIEPVGPVGPKTYTLSIEASKGGSATTRALTPGDKSLVSTWETSDIVYVTVTKSGESSSCGSLQPKTSGSTATLSGTITGTFAQGDDLTFQYPRQTIDYTGQIGTLADISAKYDYSVATATVGTVGDNSITVSGFNGFTNQQAIVKFTLKDKAGADISATSLTISAEGLKTSDTATGDIIVTPTSATNALYVALSGIENTTVTLIAKTATDTYIYEKSGVTFSDEKYYEITVKMENIRSIPLTFEAVKDGDTTITFSNGEGSKVECSVDGGKNWFPYSSYIAPLGKGGKICFRLLSDGYTANYYSADGPIFYCDKECIVYGNIMSLVDPTYFATATTLEEGVTFWGLFKGNTKIMSDPNKPLLLPATTLSKNCYKTMFYGCTNLTRAPVLPASTLVANCYELMFYGCTSLSYVKCMAKYIKGLEEEIFSTALSSSECTTSWLDEVANYGTFVSADGVAWPSGVSGNPWGSSE